MRVRAEHWHIILDCCERNPELITNRFNGPAGKAKGNAIWQNLTSKLNSLGFGEKSVEGWRKALTDWKCKTKSKASALKREQNQTGGGPPELPPLSSLEEKLLSLMGTKALLGDESIFELGLGKVETPRENTNLGETQTVGEEIQSSSLQDHDYHTRDTNTTKKIKLGYQISNKSTKSKYMQKKGTNTELLNLSQETVNLLQNIDTNLSSISNSLTTISNSLQIIANSSQQNANY